MSPILVGGLRTAKVMEKILLEGAADFLSLCRPLIRDAEFPNLIRRGLAKKSTCLNCNLCMTNKPAVCYQMRLRPPTAGAGRDDGRRDRRNV